jgi:N-acetyl-1-D-myo-inositol-2-amino-2-deoxy-alpha-D-glucopyranoside deacetylase
VGDELGLLCVHAHPDDEASSTGGILARYADEGLRTAVVTCTGGELGEIVGRDMVEDEVRPRLGQVRLGELERALRILGCGPPRLLGYRDSGMPGTEGNADASSFWRANLDEAVGRLVAQIREFRPDVLVTYDAYGGYGHPDHVQTHRVTLVAAEASAVPQLYPDAGPAWRVPKLYLATWPKTHIFGLGKQFERHGLASPFAGYDRPQDVPMGTLDEDITTVVDVRPWLERKLAALRAHVSQVAEDSFFLTLPEELAPAVFGQEWFIRQRGVVPASGPASGPLEDDLFAGLRESHR